MIATKHLTTKEKQAVTEIKKRVLVLTGNCLKGFYLFGSKARGDYDPESDVDLAIIVEGLTRETKQNIINIVADAEVKYYVVISSLVLSEANFNLLLQRERRIALDIINEGLEV